MKGVICVGLVLEQATTCTGSYLFFGVRLQVEYTYRNISGLRINWKKMYLFPICLALRLPSLNSEETLNPLF